MSHPIEQYDQALFSNAIHDSGDKLESHTYEKPDTDIGPALESYQKNKARKVISYVSQQTLLGTALIGATDRGICFLQFGDKIERLLEQLKSEYPKAEIKTVPQGFPTLFNHWMNSLDAFLCGQVNQLKLPLDIFGTEFQKIVWEYLTTIPAGKLKTYQEVATAIGKPTAFRAVANACGKNKIAIAIPCHRVIRSDGKLAGFKWGLARKRTLIDLERKRQAKICNKQQPIKPIFF